MNNRVDHELVQLAMENGEAILHRISDGVPGFYVTLKADNSDVVEIRNLRVGCSRVGRINPAHPRDTILTKSPDGEFRAIVPGLMTHSLDPVIVADVVYDCTEPQRIAFESGATAKIGDRRLTLRYASAESLFTMSYKTADPTNLATWIRQSDRGDPSVVPILEPAEPPSRILIRPWLKSGEFGEIARPYVCPPALNAPIQSLRFYSPAEEIEDLEVRLAQRVDRIVIRLPRLLSPAEPPGGTDNLFDLRLPSAIAEGRSDFATFLSVTTQCHIKIEGDPRLSGVPINLSGLTAEEVFEIAREEFGYASHDPDGHVITLGGEPSWFEKLIERARQLLDR